MIILLLLNSLLLLEAAIMMRLYFKDLNVTDTILGAATFYFSIIVISQETLGVLNILTAGNLLLFNLLFLLILIFLAVRAKEGGVNFYIRLKETLSSLRPNKYVLFSASVIAGFAVVKLCVNLINPPFGWDSLNYHFPFAVEWLKHRNLDTPLVISDNPCPSYYPINGSLIYLWFIFPFRNVLLADLGQAPFFILAFLSIYNICRKLKVSREYSFFAAALMSVTPNYFKQLSIAYVDVMVSAWFLIAFNFLLNLSRKIYIGGVLLFALSLGMLIGTKTIALTYGFILLIFFVYLLNKEKRGLGAVYLFLFFSVFVIATGGFSYIRNFMQTANPLYPLTFKAFGRALFKGVMDKESFTAFLRPEDYSLGKILFHEGMGAGILLFMAPGLAMFLFSLFKKKKAQELDLILISTFVFLYIAYRYVFSLPNVRYLYPMLGVGYIISLLAFGRLNFLPKQILRWMAVVCFLSALPELARHSELIVSLMLSLVIFALLIFGYEYLKKQSLKLALAGVVISLSSIGIINTDYNKNESGRYVKMVRYSGFWPDATRAWDWLNSNTTGNNIAYVGRPVPFPLYGERFKNNVYYVSVNKIDPAKLHYFPDSYYHWGADFLSLHKNLEAQGNYRSGADYAVWLDNLLKRNTDYLFIYSLHQTKDILFPFEDDWAKSAAGRFMPVFKNDTIHIYKILR